MEPAVNMRTARWSSYVVALLITAAIFATALYASDYFNNRRIAENSVLSSEIQPVGQRLAYLETQSNVDQAQLTELKRYYSLLEIKDYLLMRQVTAKCGLKPVFILYFYSNKGDCKDCEEQGYALTGLSERYPHLRVYSFDYNLGLSALQTLIDIHDMQNNPPALIINGKT